MRKLREPLWLKVTRILLACVFIFSGLTKAVDPLGFAIKVEEYFTSFNMAFMHPSAIYFAILAITAEFVLGFMLLFRISVKLTSIGYLLFMLFFFFLTLWLAVAEHLELNYGYNFGVVHDCGCFGQAIKMSNLETFLKNVVFLIPTIIIFVKRRQIPDIRLTALGQLLLTLIGALLVCGLQWYCGRNLPIIDFSDWKKGKNIEQLFIDIPAQKEIVFIYKNMEDGSLATLTTEDLNTITDWQPNFYDVYEFIDRKDSITVQGIKAPKQGFNMLDLTGIDHAPVLINQLKEAVYILFIHDLDDVNPKGIQSEAFQELILRCQDEGIDFVAITNSSEQEIEQFIAQNNITYPIYQNPIDHIKGPFIVRDAVRSNPGLILIKKGVVENKWAWRNFPNF